jgi:hypothetical protein
MLELLVSNNRVTIQKPHGMRVPNPVFSLWQVSVDFLRQEFAYSTVIRLLVFIVFQGIRVHCGPPYRCKTLLIAEL